MKKLISILFLSIAFQVSFAQGTWSELNALVCPQPASEIPHIRSALTGFSANGLVYLGTGYNFNLGYGFNDLYAFNPLTNRWVQQNPLPTVGRHNAQGGQLNGKGFITLGYDDLGFVTDSWEFDPSTQLWSVKAGFPGAERQEGFSFVINNKFYTGGGIDNSLNIQYSDLWEYDPSLNVWTAKSPIPQSLFGSKTFQIGNNGYVLGGLDSSFQWSTTMYKYDQLTDAWSTVASVPGSNVGIAMSDSLLGYASIDTSFYCFDPLANNWTLKAPFRYSAYDVVSGKVDSLFYVITSDGGALTYNPTTDEWLENYRPTGSSEIPNIYGRSVVLSDTAFFNLIKYDINNDNWYIDSLLDVNQWLFSIDSLGYAFKANTFQKFNPMSRTWTNCNPGPFNSASYAFSTTKFGYVYSLSSNLNWEFWQYDPQNDSWIIKANFPGRNQANGNSFGIKDKGYFAAGLDSLGMPIDDFWEYDEVSDTWTQKTNVPGGQRMGGCGTSWNNKGVVAFGITDPVGIDMCDINVYDEITASWSTIMHPLGCRSGNVIGFSSGNKFYVGQGEARFSMGVRDPFYDFWSYDDGTSSVADLQSNDGFQVYPNPTNGSFTIETTGSNIAKGEIVVTDLLGRIVFQNSMTSNSQKQNISINVTSGMYLVKLINDGQIINTKKIIIK